MLNQEDLDRVYRQAYLPEHLPDYVEAMSGAQAHLIGNYLCYTRKGHLIFIGYPVGVSSDDTPGAYVSACERFDPATVAIIAPDLWLDPATVEKQSRDSYYRLHLPLKASNPDAAYMVRRAKKELEVTHGSFGKEHKKLVKAFIKSHRLSAEQVYIFKHIGQYLARSSTAHLLETRKRDLLVAFTVVDSGSADYAFYLFNLRSKKENIPGASDLLFKAMVELAQSEGKKAINLGLGIHAGIRRFKEKWGGEPFLSYRSAFIQRKKAFDMERLSRKL